MSFATTSFLLFFALFLLAHRLAASHRTARNLLILAGSYFFYGCWDWRFLGLLAFSTLFDFAAARAIEAAPTPARRRAWLIASLGINLGLLGFFKYAGFFADSLARLAATVGLHLDAFTLDVVLPVGISFYTFQTMGYVIDVYRRQIPAERDLPAFAAYVAFFPQLVAGPIERAAHLLPQFHRARPVSAEDLRLGFWLIVRGLFRKVVIADTLAPLADLAFGTPAGPAALAVGTLAFGLQIYGDFAGYSDIARGTARWLGFDLMTNFNLPYLATSLRDFWRRWHISLSTWLRDYLYIPLGGNRHGPARTAASLLLTMTLGGLWHGAAWHFVVWGLWHGAGLALTRALPSVRLPRAAAWLATQLFVFAGWSLFRTGSLAGLVALATPAPAPVWLGDAARLLATILLPLALLDLAQHRAGDPDAPPFRRVWSAALVQGLMLFGILLCWEANHSPFIYFQF